MGARDNTETTFSPQHTVSLWVQASMTVTEALSGVGHQERLPGDRWMEVPEAHPGGPICKVTSPELRERERPLPGLQQQSVLTFSVLKSYPDLCCMVCCVGAPPLHGKPGVQVSRNDSRALFSELWLLVLDIESLESWLGPLRSIFANSSSACDNHHTSSRVPPAHPLLQ